MRLYTFQPLFVYDLLMSGKVWTADTYSTKVDGARLSRTLLNFRRSYDWLVQQMLARAIKPTNAATKYPVWAWQQWNGITQLEPDLDAPASRDFARKGSQVMLVLEVDPSRVLLSDYDAWNWVLNHWFLGGEAASDAFELRCAAADPKYRHGLPPQQAALRREMEESWAGIFDPAKSAEALQESPDRAIVQAVFWEIRPEDVMAAVQFEATGPTRDLPCGMHGRAA
jgi:hypothetical protein